MPIEETTGQGLEGGALGSAGLEGGALSDQGEGVAFEVEGEAPSPAPTAGEDAGSPAPGEVPSASGEVPAGADLPEYVKELQERALTTERQLNQMLTLLGPVMQQQHRPPQLPPPPVTPEQIKSGDVTPEQLAQYIDYQLAVQRQQIEQSATLTALRTTSEQQVRGQLNPNAMPKGWDYDTVRSRYFAQIERANPAIRHLVTQIFPHSPALGEYWVSLLTHVAEKASDDPVKTAQAFIRALETPAAERKATVDAINRTAERGAARILGGRTPVGRTATRKIRSGDDVMSMSDAEFAEFDRQFGAKI